jgi:hypothetical protein
MKLVLAGVDCLAYPSSRGSHMFRFATIVFLCFASLAGKPLCGYENHPPWVSCFSESLEHWEGAKTVRTPTVVSTDGKLRAYAKIEARASGPLGCENTVRLFVKTQTSTSFRQVFMQKPSDLGGSANSLGPNSWSPDGRWLLVEFGHWSYFADGGGIDFFLYDNKNGKIVSPDLTRIIKTTLRRECSIGLVKVIGFDAFSRVHLKLADDTEEGEDQPITHCFHEAQEWVLDLGSKTIQPISAHL